MRFYENGEVTRNRSKRYLLGSPLQARLYGVRPGEYRKEGLVTSVDWCIRVYNELLKRPWVDPLARGKHEAKGRIDQ